MRAIMIGLLPCLVGTAWALTGEEYQASTLRLKQNQQKTNSMVKQMMADAGLAPAIDAGKKEEKKIQPLFQVHGDLSEMRLGVGRLLYGRTLNRLVVGSEPSPVLVVLDSDQGAFSDLRIMGLARQSSTPGRVSVEIGQLLLHTGKAIRIQGAGLDAWGGLGLEAQVFSDKAMELAGAMASSFVSGIAATQQAQSIGAFGVSQVQPTGRNALLGGLAQTAADQSKRFIDEATQEKPVLVVAPDTSISVVVTEEVRY